MTSPETRFLVRTGLSPENLRNPFLLQALESMDFQLKGKLNTHTIGWTIAPLFNATARIGSKEEKQTLFLSLLDDAGRAEVPSGKRGANGTMVPYTEEALRQAVNTKSRQTRRQDKLVEFVDAAIVDEELLENKVIIVTIDDFDKDQRALSGLIANKIQDWYRRPCILVYIGEDGFGHGSARAPSSIEAFADFRQQCKDSGICTYAEGHPQAFGIGIHNSRIGDLTRYFNAKYDGVDVSPTYEVDFIIDFDDPYLEDVIFDLVRLEGEWGTGIKEPLIAITNVQLDTSTATLMSANKNPTLKVECPTGVEIMKFKSSREEYDSLIIPYDPNTATQSRMATFVGKASINEWGGKVTPQIITEAYEVHDVEYVF